MLNGIKFVIKKSANLICKRREETTSKVHRSRPRLERLKLFDDSLDPTDSKGDFKHLFSEVGSPCSSNCSECGSELLSAARERKYTKQLREVPSGRSSLVNSIITKMKERDMIGINNIDLILAKKQ